MSRASQFTLGLMAATVLAVRAQNPTPPPVDFTDTFTNPVSTTSALQSPVSFFRKLLVLSPPELNDALTNRPPEARERILAKIEEYKLLPPNEREARLRATDLRWWLTPMLGLAPDARANRLARVPEDLRPLINSRLEQWSILPPTLQEEYLANEQALRYFALLPMPPSPAVVERQQKIAASFNRLFELTPDEKEETLNTLPETERAQMEDTLKAFNHLPPQQREVCLRSYTKFAGMTAGEQAEFLKNAERWSTLTPEERQSWRELVNQVPIWPVGWTPPSPPPLPPDFSSPNPATNLN